MTASIVLKTDVHFGFIFRRFFWPEMVELGLWQPKVQCLYTLGKTDRFWKARGGPESDASGVVYDALRAEDKDDYGGTVLVDVRQIAKGHVRTSLMVPGPGNPGGGLRRTPGTFNDFRFKVIQVAAHEYYHLIQHWRVGPEAFRRSYSETFHRLRREAMRQMKAARPGAGDGMLKERAAAAAHARHPAEQAAERIAHARVARRRGSIDKGLLDAALPMEMLRTEYQRIGGRLAK